MKRMFIIGLALFMLLPTAAMAHSKLERAEPGQGAVVDASPENITMAFDTKIEKLSTFKLFNDAGEEIEKGDIVVDGPEMTAALTESLENGDYVVKWTIIGADSHVVEGEYGFTVDAPAAATPEATADAAEEPTEPPASGEPDSPNDAAETPLDPTADPAAEPAPGAGNAGESDATQTGTGYVPFIIIGAIIVAAAIVIAVRRRKP